MSAPIEAPSHHTGGHFPVTLKPLCPKGETRAEMMVSALLCPPLSILREGGLPSGLSWGGVLIEGAWGLSQSVAYILRCVDN